MKKSMLKQQPPNDWGSQDERKGLHQYARFYYMRLARLIVTFFYIGNAKIAPGSIASIATSLLFYLYAKYIIYYFFIIIILATIFIAFFCIKIYAEFRLALIMP